MKRYGFLHCVFTIVFVAAFVLVGAYLLGDTPYTTPNEDAYYLCEEDGICFVAATGANNVITLAQTYYGADGIAAESRVFTVKGIAGKKIIGPYYLLGESVFGIRKAPYDTRPAAVTLTCTEYNSYGIDSTNREKEGSKIKGVLYQSEKYLILDNQIHERIAEEDLPAEVLLPLAAMYTPIH